MQRVSEDVIRTAVHDNADGFSPFELFRAQHLFGKSVADALEHHGKRFAEHTRNVDGVMGFIYFTVVKALEEIFEKGNESFDEGYFGGEEETVDCEDSTLSDGAIDTVPNNQTIGEVGFVSCSDPKLTPDRIAEICAGKVLDHYRKMGSARHAPSYEFDRYRRISDWD